MNKPTRPGPQTVRFSKYVAPKPKTPWVSGVFFLVLLLVASGIGWHFLTHSGGETAPASKKQAVQEKPAATPIPAPVGAEPEPEAVPKAVIPAGPSPEEIARAKSRIEVLRAIEATSAQAARHDFASAAKALEAWQAAHGDSSDRAIVGRQIARLHAAEGALPALIANPAVLVGAQIPVGSALAPISSLANGRLMIQAKSQFGTVERPVEFASLSEASLVQLLQRADATGSTTLAPAYLLGLGKIAEARAALRDGAPKAEAFRADLADAEEATRDGALVSTLDAVEALIQKGDLAKAQETLTQCLSANSDHPFIKLVYGPQIAEWRTKVASAAAAAAPTPATPVAVADPYPGLPAFSFAAANTVGSPDLKQMDAAGQWAARTGKWNEHFAQLKTTLIANASAGAAMQRGQNIAQLLAIPSASLAIEEAKFIHAVGSGTLSEFSKNEDGRAFLKWLFAHPQILATFNYTIRPQDNSSNSLGQWLNIWKDDSESRESLANLAIACAVVFDRPIRINSAVFGKDESQSAARSSDEVEALARFRFFRDSAKRGALKVNLAEMAPWELVWVVDAPVPDSELLWAQKNAHFTRHDWGKAYPHIRYRMDRATQGVNPYSAYTLAEIEKEGGICGDQAYFASITAKANGIPAMIIGGEGDRGGHAWFGYEAARGEWNLNSGRYADNYAAGTTRDPQSKRNIKEHELKQLTDPVRRTEAYQKSERLTAFARFFTDAGQPELASVAYASALQLAPTNHDAWIAHLDSLAAAKVPSEEWLRESARMRTTFAKFSDIVQEINKREADYLAINGNAADAQKLVSRQATRMEHKDGERTDLIIEDILHAANLATQAGDAEGAERIYRNGLRDKGNEVVAFRKLAGPYYTWAKNNNKGPAVVHDLVNLFDRKHPEPTNDVFAMGAYKGVLETLIGMVKEQGDEALQRKLERRDEELTKKKDKLGKEQSKGADRT